MADMFRAPLHRGMRTLDRTKFSKCVPIRAARVFDSKNISSIRSELQKSQDALRLERIGSVYSDPDPKLARLGRKCILLKPDHHSPTVTELAQKELISVIPYDLQLDYSHWTYHDILTSLLPEVDQEEIPSGFSQVGHVAHLNIRDQYLPYKHIIAEVLMDKNPAVSTVINKIDDVGEESEYRTFRYEVLAGADDMNVKLSEENCVFEFDYSKVYWNSRLHTEHARMVSFFQEGEAVCDVMAGIGPFAVPAGKKKVFVWANDLNPDSFKYLKQAIRRNKVTDFVRPFNDDGRNFIKTAAQQLASEERTVEVKNKKGQVTRKLTQPRTFQHYVLNLPASALTFLSSFVGLKQQPLIHVYCFNTKSDDNVEEGIKICDEISSQLRHEMKPGKVEEGGVEIHDVRDVAPKKRMFCASFRLPHEVAFG
ncbi:hypothetical protein K470DRAFT_257571 [Piedraia hortae CBS 480.64]|uniref:tRNA (guanine(37)-N1)-methyltransferase n=1 Tax=Piedraia hortae CBS 480.64 TaxID=1314780 RepID=A0A6A7BZN7_9PEZI|nr:hypothetical protein K470DRAFT_257571 [Piedraia hortae CBS 480.64]